MSLQERLVIVVVAAIMPLAAVSMWFVWRDFDASTEATHAQLRFTASAVASAQDRIVDSVHHLLGAITTQPQLRDLGPDACSRNLAPLREQYPLYANMGILDPQGRLVCIARGTPLDPDRSDRSYFKRAIERRSFVIGEAMVGRVRGTYVLAFAMPMMDGDRIAGVVFATLDLQQAASGLAAMDLPEGARVTILDRSGKVLMQYPPHGALVPARQIKDAQLLEAARQLAARSGELTDDDGQQRIYAASPTRRIAGEGLVAVVSLDRDQLTAAWQRRLANVIAAALLSLLAGLAAAWWIGSRFIVRPTRQILGGVKNIEQGRLDARVPLGERKPRGEFSRIAAAFNLMAESLQMRQNDIESELGRSRAAYAVLDTVLNSMQEGLVAVDRGGHFILFNRAAARLFPLDGERPLVPQEWPRQFGIHQPGAGRLYAPDELPFARAIRGEQGEMLVLVRNALVRHERLLRCNFTPMRDDERITGGLVVFTDVTELEQAETDLVLLRNAVARLNDVVLITEAAPIASPGPRIVFVNEAFERLTGYSAREAIGNTPRMLQGPGTDRATLDRIRRALERGEPVREELLNYAKDGRTFWLELDIVPLADEAGRYTHLIAVQRDITARKQFEQQLLASERELHEFSGMLQRTAEAAQAIARHQGVELTTEEVARQARHVIRVERAEVIVNAENGETEHRVICAPDRLVVPLVDGRGVHIGFLQLTGKLEGEFGERDQHVAVELAQLASIAIENARLFQQIRELNQNLETRIADRTAEMFRQGRLYRTLAEQAPEVVWNTDATGTKLTFLNRAWYDLVGGSESDWIGRSGLPAIHPDDQPEVSANWKRCRETLSTFTGVRRLRAKDGTYHTMSYKGAPVFDENGQVAFWVGIDSDITGFKSIEEALRSSNQELEAFSYSVSHDLRAPLGAIDGFSKALASKLEGLADDRSRHYLSRIQAGVVKMEQLIEALLGLSRVAREPLTPTAVDLSAIARDTLEGLQMQQPQRHVTTRVAEGLVVQGDARLLRVLMENLLGNAWKFTSRTEGAVIEVGRGAEGNVFFVQDNGVGFDMNYAGKLFTAFQRLHTDSEFPGTGIGLATVRRIVARHHGRVWPESRPGEGTTFYFTLGD